MDITLWTGPIDELVFDERASQEPFRCEVSMSLEDFSIGRSGSDDAPESFTQACEQSVTGPSFTRLHLRLCGENLAALLRHQQIASPSIAVRLMGTRVAKLVTSVEFCIESWRVSEVVVTLYGHLYLRRSDHGDFEANLLEAQAVDYSCENLGQLTGNLEVLSFHNVTQESLYLKYLVRRAVKGSTQGA